MKILAYLFVIVGLIISVALLYPEFRPDNQVAGEVQIQFNPDFSEREAKRYNAFVASYLQGVDNIGVNDAITVGETATEILRLAVRESSRIYDPATGFIFWMHVSNGLLFIWDPQNYRFEGIIDIRLLMDIGGSRRDRTFYQNMVASMWYSIQLIQDNGLQPYIDDGSVFSLWGEPTDINISYAYSIFDRVVSARRDSEALADMFADCVLPVRDNLIDNANVDILELFYIEPEIGVLYAADILATRYEMVWIDTSDGNCEPAETINGFSIVTAE